MALFVVTGSQRERYDLSSPPNDIILEIDNSEDTDVAATLRLTDVVQTDPAGRYQIRVSGTGFYIERSTSADWAAKETLFAFDTAEGGISQFLLSEAGLNSLAENILLYQGSPALLKLGEAIFVALASLGVKP